MPTIVYIFTTVYLMLVETLSQGEGTHDKISGAEECEDSN